MFHSFQLWRSVAGVGAAHGEQLRIDALIQRMSNVSGVIKSIQDIMRKDVGVDAL